MSRAIVHAGHAKQKQSHGRKRPGFSAIEMLIAIGLMTTAAGLMVPMFREYQINADLNTATEHLVQAVRSAQTLSQAGKFDTTWGVYFPDAILFAGGTYSERDTDHDVSFPIASTIDTSGLDETTFSRVDGLPSAIGSVYVTSSATNSYRRIDIDRNGVVTVSGILTFAPGELPTGNSSSAGSVGSSGSSNSNAGIGGSSASNTNSSVTAGTSSSAGSTGTTSSAATGTNASSSVASSSPAGASSSVSSVSSEIADDEDDGDGDDSDDDDTTDDTDINNQPCETSFLAKGKIELKTVGSNDVKVKVLGSAITYGADGPKIDVRVSASTNGTQWDDLFGGKAIATGDLQSIDNLPSGTPIMLRINGRYSWLFNKTYQSNANDGHTYILRDGDTAPSYAPFSNQQSLQSFLKSVLDSQGKVKIGPNDILVIAELGTLDQNADFQDAVLLLSFKKKPNSCVDKAKQRVKIHFDRLENTGNGDAAKMIYVGPNAIAFSQNQRIPLVDSKGDPIIDGGLQEDVKGLALERGAGWIRIVSHGSHPDSSGKEIVDAKVRFKRAYIQSIENDPANPAENPFDGLVNDTASGDEFSLNPSKKFMLFQSRVTTKDDGVMIYWASGKPPHSGSSSSRTSAVSSSASSAPTTIVTDACGVPFTIDGRGIITLKGKADVTVKIVGSDSTYGLRGPKVSVRSGISFNDGASWKPLFGDRAMKGGELSVFRDTLSGSKIALSFNGRYSWVFNKTVRSDDHDSHVRVLRSGETCDGLRDIRSRGEMHAYLKNIVNKDANIAIGNHDVAILVELGDADHPNYHDAVAILSIDKPQSLGSCIVSSSSSSSIASQASSISSSMDTNKDTDSDSVKDRDDLCPTGTTFPESVPTEYMTFDRYALTSARGNANTVPVFRTGPRKKISDFTIRDTRGCSCSQIIDAIENKGSNRFGEYPVLFRQMKNIFPFSATDARKFGCSSALLKLIAEDQE